ncbi:MAG TPA: universal stress protein [Gemmatimonadaceae bacterium]|jgi:nucleotide-binding universal stress UspA family protein|nr:universal stress protein [Gemmatimonadaceae bacterium]
MSAFVPTTQPMDDARPTDARPLTLHRELLLATDASAAASAATRVAAALAARWSTTPHVCTVIPSPPTAMDPTGISIAYAPSIAEEMQRAVTDQLASCCAESSGWSRETGSGAPASEIVRIADTRSSDLIALGLRPHAFFDRLFRDETALSVMRHASMPVLAVTPLLTRLPRRIAVAIDFSRASIAAARAALTLIDDGGSLMLVYVEPPGEPRSPSPEGFTTIYTQGVTAAFTRLRLELASRTNARIETVVLRGGVAAELQSFAYRAEVDLLAVGSQRHSIARQAFVGSVTSALARAATTSLFVIPPGRRA